MKNILFQITDMASAIFNRRERNKRNEDLLRTVFGAIEHNDQKTFESVLQKPLTSEQQNVILATTVEHNNIDFLNKALNVCDPSHKYCGAIIVAINHSNLSAVRILAPLSLTINCHRAAAKCIFMASTREEDDDIRMECFKELLKWIDPKFDSSYLLQEALRYKDQRVVDLIWDRSDLKTVANTDPTLYGLGHRNDVDNLNQLWKLATLEKQKQAVCGAVANGHIELMNQLIERLGRVDCTEFLIEAVKCDQEECFEILLPQSDPEKALETFTNILKTEKETQNSNPQEYQLVQRLKEHCESVRLKDVLNHTIAPSVDTLPAQKRRM